MRINYGVPFHSTDIESYRQLVFNNLTQGLTFLVDSLWDLGLDLGDALLPHAEMIASIARGGNELALQPEKCLGALLVLWNDPTVKEAVSRGNEIALMEK